MIADLSDHLKLSGQISDRESLVGSLSNGLFSVSGIKLYYDSMANWNAQSTMIAEKKAIYVYKDYIVHSNEDGNQTFVPGMKIGDGTSYLIDMPFIGSSYSDIDNAINEHINNTQIHLSENDRNKLDNTVEASVIGDTLTFSI